MQFIKLFLKMFIGVPLTIIGLLGLLGSLIDGEYLSAFGIVLFLLLFFWICGWDSRRDEKKLKETVLSRGLKIDYMASYLGGGIVIDLKNEKLVVGNLKAGKILNFNEVKSIEWKDTPYHNKMKYSLYVNTNNFETPQLGAGFAGDKGMRDAAYAKLSAALKFS